MPWPDEQGRWVAGRTCALRFYLPIPIPTDRPQHGLLRSKSTQVVRSERHVDHRNRRGALSVREVGPVAPPVQTVAARRPGGAGSTARWLATNGISLATVSAAIGAREPCRCSLVVAPIVRATLRRAFVGPGSRRHRSAQQRTRTEATRRAFARRDARTRRTWRELSAVARIEAHPFTPNFGSRCEVTMASFC